MPRIVDKNTLEILTDNKKLQKQGFYVTGVVYTFCSNWYHAGCPEYKNPDWRILCGCTPYLWNRYHLVVMQILHELMPKLKKVCDYRISVSKNHHDSCKKAREGRAKKKKIMMSEKSIQNIEFSEQINPTAPFIPVQSSPRKFHEGFSDQHAIDKAKENNKVESGLSFKD